MDNPEKLDVNLWSCVSFMGIFIGFIGKMRKALDFIDNNGHQTTWTIIIVYSVSASLGQQ